MSDKPVLPLTLYRLTLETDDKKSFDFLRLVFMDSSWTPNEYKLEEARKHIIGVETRIRERVEHDQSSDE